MLDPIASRKLAFAMYGPDVTAEQRDEIALQAMTAKKLTDLPTWMQDLILKNPMPS